MNELLISYVITTRDRPKEVFRCLNSVRAQDYPRKQIVVVDNGSTDDSASAIRKEFPEANLIVLGANRGVAGGRNRGAASADGEICVFIDDDAQFADAQATQRIVRYFGEDPRLACLAFKICDPSTGLEDYRAIPRADKRSVQHDYPCAYFCGAGFALRRQALLDVGLFWDRLVYAGEELDLSYRFVDRGYRLLHTASVDVIHREVPAARQRGQRSYFYARNRCWVATRNLPWPYAVTTTGFWWSYILVTSTLKGELSFAVRGICDALRGLPSVLHERRCVGKETVQVLNTLSGRLWY